MTITTADNQPYILATLDASSVKIMSYLQHHLESVAASVKQFQQAGKKVSAGAQEPGQADTDWTSRQTSLK